MKKLKGITIWRCLSLTWLLFLSAAYFWPTDALYAITIWPPFVWAGLAFVLSLAGFRRHRTRAQWLLLFAWFSFWTGFGEEKLWIPSRAFEFYDSESHKFVTLNCAGGSVEAAQEALDRNPAILLLQESPSRKELEKLADSGYSLISGPDASIMVDGKGRLDAIELPRGTSNFVAGVARLYNQEPILVVSLRLQPPIFRLDYWSPDCWQAYTENRERRRAEFAEIMRFIKPHAEKVKWVVIGGDFNTPPDSGTFAPLSGWLTDASRDSGYTATNEFPMARIDQIWTNIYCFSSRAYQTKNSDHRLVQTWHRPVFRQP